MDESSNSNKKRKVDLKNFYAASTGQLFEYTGVTSDGYQDTSLTDDQRKELLDKNKQIIQDAAERMVRLVCNNSVLPYQAHHWAQTCIPPVRSLVTDTLGFADVSDLIMNYTFDPIRDGHQALVPTIQLSTVSANTAQRFSKFGGVPYLPPGEEWPVCRLCNTHHVFYFQILISEMPPSFHHLAEVDRVTNQPKIGSLIQLFLCNDSDEHALARLIEVDMQQLQSYQQSDNAIALSEQHSFPAQEITDWTIQYDFPCFAFFHDNWEPFGVSPDVFQKWLIDYENLSTAANDEELLEPQEHIERLIEEICPDVSNQSNIQFGGFYHPDGDQGSAWRCDVNDCNLLMHVVYSGALVHTTADVLKYMGSDNNVLFQCPRHKQHFVLYVDCGS